MTMLTTTASTTAPPTDDEVRDELARVLGRRGRAGRHRPTSGMASDGWRRALNLWARRLHVYTSMATLLIVLFFGISGITLNHPTWTFGDEASTETVSGEFPFTVTSDDGTVQFLSVAEFVRAEHGVGGSVANYQETNGEGSIAFKNAGYAADLFFDTETGQYDLAVTQEGWVGVMNDLHKGRDTGAVWSWVIDLSAGFLVVISLTGIIMQLYLRRRRVAAFATAGVGTVITAALIALTLA